MRFCNALAGEIVKNPVSKKYLKDWKFDYTDKPQKVTGKIINAENINTGKLSEEQRKNKSKDLLKFGKISRENNYTVDLKDARNRNNFGKATTFSKFSNKLTESIPLKKWVILFNKKHEKNIVGINKWITAAFNDCN